MNKFKAKKVIIDGITFDSIKEGNYYTQLKIQKNATKPQKKVIEINLHPRFDIIINKKKIGFYKADFEVLFEDGHKEVIDVKGCRKGCAYQLFALKKKLVEALYNIEIIEK